MEDNKKSATENNGLAPLLDKITTLEGKITTLEKKLEDTTKLNRELLNRKAETDNKSAQQIHDEDLFRKFLLEEN